MTQAQLLSATRALAWLTSADAVFNALASEAFVYSMAKAQWVARQANPDPTSLPYFDALAGALTQLGWEQVAADSWVHLPQPTPVTPMSLVDQALAQFTAATVPPAPSVWTQLATMLPQLKSALQGLQATQAAPVNRALGLSRNTLDCTCMTLGPLVEWDGSPWFVGAHVNFSVPVVDINALFAAVADISFVAHAMCMRLDLAHFEQLLPGLKAELAEQIDRSVSLTSLDLSTFSLEFAP
jgi:hypothetical protein